MLQRKINAVVFFTFISAISAAHAMLTINVTGLIGENTTTWTITGEYDIDGAMSNFGWYSSKIGTVRDTNVNHFNHVIGTLSGEYASDSNFNDVFAVALSSNATVTGSESGVHEIDGLFLDSDGSFMGDDFGWFAGGSFGPAETLTFSGSLMMEYGIELFGEGPTAIINEGDFLSVSSSTGITPLSISFTAIPEHSSAGFFIGIIMLLAVFRRRARS